MATTEQRDPGELVREMNERIAAQREVVRQQRRLQMDVYERERLEPSRDCPSARYAMHKLHGAVR